METVPNENAQKGGRLGAACIPLVWPLFFPVQPSKEFAVKRRIPEIEPAVKKKWRPIAVATAP